MTFRVLTNDEIMRILPAVNRWIKQVHTVFKVGWLFCQEDKWQLSRRSRLTAGGGSELLSNFNSLREGRRIIMTAELLVNVTPSETRVAYIDGGILRKIHIEREARRGIVGNIYKGRVKLPGMQAAL